MILQTKRRLNWYFLALSWYVLYTEETSIRVHTSAYRTIWYIVPIIVSIVKCTFALHIHIIWFIAYINPNYSVKLVGWLAVLGLTALRDSISVYIGPSPREREKETRKDRWEKNVQTIPPAPTASAVGPCPTFIQISRTPRHWKFTQHHRTTRLPQFGQEFLQLHRRPSWIEPHETGSKSIIFKATP